jgi:hypothetical protein
MSHTTKESCDQCVAVYINGIFCHEHECPNVAALRDALDYFDEEDLTDEN